MSSEQKKSSSFFGDILRVKGITTEKLAQLTGVSERFLKLLSEERYDKLPATPYVHGYIIKIGDVLNMNGEELWQEYQKHSDVIRGSGEHDRLPENRFTQIKINKKIIAIAGIVLIVLVYIAFRIPTFLGKPTLSIDIENNTVVSTSTLVITGATNPKNELTINNETLYPDTDGNFTKTIELSPGFNTFTFKVKKLLGGEEILVRQIFFKTSSSASTSTEEKNKQ